jgi:plasmid stabilization system protein ParE
MAYQVIFKKRFINKLQKTLLYVEEEWGIGVAEKLLNRLDQRFDTLSRQPLIGASSEKIKGSRSFLFTKHNRIYYRVKDDRIEILNIYDTRINPKRNPY